MPRKKKRNRNRRPAGGGGGGLDRSELAAQYGWALSTLRSNKELWALFDEAVSMNYTPARFVAGLRDTKWFKKHSEAQRKYLVLKTSDPKQFKSLVNQRMAGIRDMWTQMGGSAPTKQTLATLADQSLRLGLDEAQLTNRVSDAINWKSQVARGSVRGTGASNLSQLRKLSSQYGIRLSNDWYARALESIASNSNTIDAYQNHIKEFAKKRYTQFADELDGGKTMEDIADQYKQAMGQIWEQNPNGIDVFNPMVQRALNHKEKRSDGAWVPVQMSLGQFEDALRADERWQYTQNAHATVDKMSNDLLTKWGLKA